MPILLGPQTNRRDFLKTIAFSVAGTALAGGCARFPAARRKPSKEIRWALLADTHVSLKADEKYRNFAIDDNFKTAVAQVVARAPQGMVIAGDVARLQGKLDDYRMFLQLVEPAASRMPVAMALGNHDDRNNFNKALGSLVPQKSLVANKHVEVIETGGLRLIILDSLLFVEPTPGLLGKVQRAWLAKFLDESERLPTFLFFHHDLGDGDGSLLDGDRLLKIVLPRTQVKAVFYGHTHNCAYNRTEGLHLVNLPAVGYSFSDKQPVGWLEAKLSAEGGEFTLRAFGSNVQDNGKTQSLAWRA